MSIKKADSAGFCFGVNRAINIVNELLEKGIKVSTLGPIIHNMEMVHELEERGCTPVKAIDELTDDTTLVIRSHGVEKSVIDSLVKRGINFEDATCPFVKKIHKIVSNTNPENDVVLIAGNKNHPEVCGIIGHCASDCYTFNNEAELDDLLPNILKKNNVVVIFGIDKSTYTFLNEQYPEARFYSQSTPLIEYFSIKSRLGNSKKMYASVRKDAIDIYCFERGQLLLANSFECMQTEDRIYYLLYVWKQLEFNQERDELHLTGTLSDKETLMNELKKFILQVFIMNPANNIDMQALLTCE